MNRIYSSRFPGYGFNYKWRRTHRLVRVQARPRLRLPRPRRRLSLRPCHRPPFRAPAIPWLCTISPPAMSHIDLRTSAYLGTLLSFFLGSIDRLIDCFVVLFFVFVLLSCCTNRLHLLCHMYLTTDDRHFYSI